MGERTGTNPKDLDFKQAQRLLESVHSNTDQHIAKIKQTLVATYESKKEILI